MIPYGRQFISPKDIDAVVDVLKSDFLTQGPKVDEFESAISSFVKSKHCVAVNSATSALHISCLSIGVGKGDIVWTVPNSFVATSNAALYCGAQVDFVDISEHTNNICIEALERKLIEANNKNKLPKALITVHLAGLSCSMKEIKDLSDIYNFRIIEDASHCIGGDYIKDKIGSCKYSDLCVFSFHPVKIITTGEGGAIMTNSQEIYNNLNMLRSHGITRLKEDFVDSEVPDWYYQQQLLGFNYRMTDIQAALGISQLTEINSFISKRRDIANFYIDELNSKFDVVSKEINKGSSNHLFIIKTKKRDELRNVLLANKIFTTLHYFPIHLQPYYQNMGFKIGDFPVAESYGEKALSIPIHQGLAEKDMHYIVNILKTF